MKTFFTLSQTLLTLSILTFSAIADEGSRIMHCNPAWPSHLKRIEILNSIDQVDQVIVKEYSLMNDQSPAIYTIARSKLEQKQIQLRNDGEQSIVLFSREEGQWVIESSNLSLADDQGDRFQVNAYCEMN